MDKLIEVRNLKKYFPIKGGIFRRTVGQLKAVDDVSFTLGSSQTLGLVGESGCGKSALGRAILRLYEPTEGRLFLEGVEFTKTPLRQMEAYRRKMQIIFQDPNASLNPRMTVREIVQEPLNVHEIGARESRRKQVEESFTRQKIQNNFKWYLRNLKTWDPPLSYISNVRLENCKRFDQPFNKSQK
jgi:ABC-type microcin C transport system duplicated ATPase subunit YejF